MADIVIHPENEELRRLIEEHKTMLADLISKRDELLKHTCPNLAAEYSVKVGHLENKLYEKKIDIRRLRREIALVMAKFSRMEKPDMDEIRRQVDKEFTKYQRIIEELLREYLRSLERIRMKTLSEKDSAELKRMYRYIVKKLHPDLNPERSESQKKLLLHANDAFERGDIATMRELYDIVKDDDEMDFESGLSGIEHLRKRADDLKKSCSNVAGEIDKIMNSFPCDKRDFLCNEPAVEARRTELEKLIAECEEQIEKLKLRLSEMLGE